MMKSRSQPRSYLFLCRLLAGLLLAAWLAPAAHGDGWPYWPFKKEDKPGKPDKIVAVWSDTVLTQTGRPALRGFGGRLMFYEGKNEEPVKVEGNLVVYAFDETDRDANNARPDRKYAFTPEQLPGHYSKSKVGHSYSVWLPWDEVGGVQKEITLIVRFQPKEGPAAISDPCRELLPGRIEPARAKTPAAPVSRLWASPWATLRPGQRRRTAGVVPDPDNGRQRSSDRGMAAKAPHDDDHSLAVGIGDPLGDQFAPVCPGSGRILPNGARVCGPRARAKLPAAKLCAAELPAPELPAAGLCSASAAFVHAARFATAKGFRAGATGAIRRAVDSAKS